ncbi:thioredoxin [Hirschia litorea]|uniref:Thioredoxin n=1 Tax=Hirschia litorea TaxID=1199156 RepID=A0ABW2IKM7_9PROT
MSVINTTDDKFDEDVIQSEGTIIVDFWAEWCGPCKQVSPHLEALAKEKEGEIKIVKVNVDENPMTSGRFGVRGMPTLMIFKEGKVAATHLGAMSKSRIEEWIAESA